MVNLMTLRPTISPLIVHQDGGGFHVGGIHARTVTAEMVNGETLGDGANKEFICMTMDTFVLGSCPFAIGDMPIPVAVGIPHPLPTTSHIILPNVCPEITEHRGPTMLNVSMPPLTHVMHLTQVQGKGLPSTPLNATHQDGHSFTPHRHPHKVLYHCITREAETP